MSIRFKVILPYLLLTLIVAVTGAYVVTRLVSSSLEERLSNQLLESGRVVSDQMVQLEYKNIQSARVIAFTSGLGQALQAGNDGQIALLVKPAAGGLNIESAMVFDNQGHEKLHVIKQIDGSLMDVSVQNHAATLPIVSDLLAENNADSLPKRVLALDPIDGRYYYFTTLPIVSGNDVVGAVVVGTSVNTIMPMLKSTSLADVVIYDTNGKSIASTLVSHGSEAPLFLQTISIQPSTYQQVINQDKTVEGDNVQVDGRWYKVARGPLKISGDRLAVYAVILPLDFVVESSSTNRVNYTILYSIAMFGVIVIGYVVARLIVNPLSTLVRASRAIANGDLSQRTKIKTRDEIGVLSNTFDEMTENLQQRTIELEETNRILEQMDRTKMRFIQVSAHELRTPMTLVQGYAQMVQLKTNGNADMERYTRGMLEGTGRMVEIIDNMLDVSRIDSNLLEISPAEAQIDQIIEKITKTFSAAFEERKITFKTQGLLDLPVITADKDLLYKVFYHVVGNAIKYTPDGGSVTVSGRIIEDPKDPEVEIAVKDTGIGIDAQFHELIFEKFYQTGEVLLHSSGKTKFKGGGPGLGLAIARGIINAHHGRIWLESAGNNEETYPGSTVYIRLSINGRFNAKNA
ncbi:MAG: ATP-binding protein [Chloroflexota bacterium]